MALRESAGKVATAALVAGSGSVSAGKAVTAASVADWCVCVLCLCVAPVLC